MKIYIIDVDSGNLRSLVNAVESLGYEVGFVTSKQEMIDVLDVADRVILPGVGNFGHFMDQVNKRDLAGPIRQYAESGKPLMGICVGLQSIFTGSVESPDSEGLALLSGTLGKFDDSNKSVPHIGWNSALSPVNSSTSLYGIEPSEKYYFVHSYAMFDVDTVAKSGWEYVVTSYGSETFVAALAKGNTFFTQFHPEKSGAAGLKVIDCFIKQTKSSPLDSSKPALTPGLTKRVIACLDVRSNDQGDLVVTKGDQYDVREKSEGGGVRNLGKPVEVAQKYYEQGADEVTFLNITSFRNSPFEDQPMLDVLRMASKSVFVPLTIGGGIRDTVNPDGKIIPAVEVAHLYFRSGADKVSIGSDAVYAAEKYYANGKKPDGSSPMEAISKPYGAQAVVVSVDPKRVYVKDPSDAPNNMHTFKTKFLGPNGEEYVWYQCTVKGGREARDLGAYELAQAAEALGTGEILLNCIDKDGTNSGFDLELINDIKSAVSIPVIASSGAGNPQHFVEVFEKTPTDAALGAGMFHRNEYKVDDVKEALFKEGLNVRR